MVDFANEKEFEAWLQEKPREWGGLLALRAALRVLPALANIASHEGISAKNRKIIILPVLRVMALPWIAVQNPALGNDRKFLAAALSARSAALATLSDNSTVGSTRSAIISGAYAARSTFGDVVASTTLVDVRSAARVATESAMLEVRLNAFSASQSVAWRLLARDASLLEQGSCRSASSRRSGPIRRALAAPMEAN